MLSVVGQRRFDGLSWYLIVVGDLRNFIVDRFKISHQCPYGDPKLDQPGLSRVGATRLLLDPPLDQLLFLLRGAMLSPSCSASGAS